MSVVNSGIGTKACMYDFNHDGPLGNDSLGNPIFVFSGIAFKPGDIILDVRAQVFAAVTDTAAGATSFNLNWSPLVSLFAGTVTQLSTCILAFWGKQGIGIAAYNFSDSGVNDFKPHIVFGTNTSLNVTFSTSGGSITAGKIGFLITYAFSRF
jgi:hypothetical protein